mgnify:FL=1
MFAHKENIVKSIMSTFIPDNSQMPERRYDLDWLRVLAFALLILYHTGMFYVENWGWHAKSNYQSQFLENIMLIVEPWRMALLWLISGISIRFILAKVSLQRFIAMRTYRLLLPLLFGILVVVPPQLYIEMMQNGDLDMNYWQFLYAFFIESSDVFIKYPSGIWPHIDVNHLWFIRSLWQFTLLMVFLLPVLNSSLISLFTAWIFKQHAVFAIILSVLPLLALQVFWESETTRYPLGFTFMIYGYLIGWNTVFWQRLECALKPLIISMVIGYCLLIYFYNVYWAKLNADEIPELIQVIGMSIYSLQKVLGVLVALTLAQKFLNKNSTLLNYLNNGVYAFYILHQTIIIVAGYHLSTYNLGAFWEPILLILITITSCLLGYEIIRKTSLLRPCFGLKAKLNTSPNTIKLGYITAALLVVPLAWKLFIWSIELASVVV